MTVKIFGHMPDGQDVHRVHLSNEHLSIGILTLGASLQSVVLDGTQLVVSSDDLDDYLGLLKYSGAIVGRVANRIANATAFIEDACVEFDANEVNGNCIHGGRDGASAHLWTLVDVGSTHALLRLELPDGHMGFPGNLVVHARYQLLGTSLRLEISAQSDAVTLCSFAPHAYWTLSDEGNINKHALRVAAQEYLPLNEKLIPTGEIAPVKSTRYDFVETREISSVALDHNFCLSTQQQELRPILWLQSARSGIALEVATTEPGVQIYDARHLDRIGLAIEPQIWPDAINQDGFPNMLLHPGETYQATTEFRLSKRA